jgi:hypothetical protein
VAYYIESRFFLKGRVICNVNREIMMMPAAEPPPPIEPDDLRNEYQLSASSVLGISWRRRQTMAISISSYEPRPLIFGDPSAGNDLPSTELLLQFSTRQLATGNEPEDLAPEISDCELTITLEAITYFLQREEYSVLSFTEAHDTPFSVVKTTKFKTQRRKFRGLNWKKAKHTDCKCPRTSVAHRIRTYF